MTRPGVSPVAPDRARARLLWGVSVAALITAVGAPGSRAQSVGALMAASHQPAVLTVMATPAVSPATSTSAAAASASARALQYQSQVNSAVNLAQQAQAAARAAAAALNAKVPDGLATGGLQVIANPTTATADPNGVNTWQGAAAPTASAQNPNQITIVQTDPRAILSWTSFNVGQHTTLTYQQQLKGVDQPGWVALNRVVGPINPMTGLPDARLAPGPTQILGAIKAPGTVLVIDQNGIMFGATAQVNVGSLVATSLEVGHALERGAVVSLQKRNTEFLDFGLLGYAEQQTLTSGGAIDTFSAQALTPFSFEPTEGGVQVAAGASLNSGDGGYLMLLAPTVVNAGQLSSADGEIALQSGRHIQLTASAGDANSVDPNVRGLVVSATKFTVDAADSVTNAASGLIAAPRGYVSIGATSGGAVQDAGVITSTTSVSENGDVTLSGQRITLAPGALIAIGPDSGAQTIPQDATSLSAFKTSQVRIGDTGSLVSIGSGSLIYAPGGAIAIGADPGATLLQDPTNALTGVVVDSGATIDAAGLTDVLVAASRNAIKIDPVKGNELANSPAFRNGFLNGAAVYLDPRLSGVNANGVAWVGSPLIAAAAYAQQVGVSAAELLTSGGSVTLGTAAYTPSSSGAVTTAIPNVTVRPGAVIDISGGWKTYQAGVVQQTYLVDSSGQVIPISQANPDDVYLGIYSGFTAAQPRWGINNVYVDPLLTGSYAAGQYIEGRDAGTLAIKTSAAVLDGTLLAGVVAGPEQIVGAAPGTASSAVYGDLRRLQAAPSQLPTGGLVSIQAAGATSQGLPTGGGDILIEPTAAYAANAAASTPLQRFETITLNADNLSASGAAQLSLATSGAIDVAAGATIPLPAGGLFEALAGRSITVDGSILAPGGSIDLTTAPLAGSLFVSEPVRPGAFDIVVNGTLSAAGRWANDFNVAAGQIVGSAYLNGGEITLAAAPRVTTSPAITNLGDPVTQTTDASGSLLINAGALIDVSGGGYVRPTGGIVTTAHGGNLSLYDDTTYFQISANSASAVAGGLSGLRGAATQINGVDEISVNPASMTTHISIADGAVRAQGFGGGGTFTLTTPSFAFGASSVTAAGGGAVLPLDFFASTGFARYRITSYGTDLFTNTLNGALGGYNALLAIQVATVGGGQTLSLTQSMFSPLLTVDQISALQHLGTGASLFSVLTPAVPTDAWDQKAVSLSLGGLLELHVIAGGQVVGAPAAALTVSQLFNEGVIRLPGGAITQSEVLPTYYGQSAIALTSLSALTLADATSAAPVYVLGDLAAGEGVRLSAGSLTDLSGEAIINPRATPRGNLTLANFVDGVVISGGSLSTINALNGAGTLFHTVSSGSVYGQLANSTIGIAAALDAAPGARVDLSGAQALFDRPTLPDAPPVGAPAVSYAATPIWSDGGALTLASGGEITGAVIQARGGAPLALGGTLTTLDPVLYQNDPLAPTANAISASMITSAGFASFVAQGRLTSVGDVTLSLPRSLFVESSPFTGLGVNTVQVIADASSPVIGAGGILRIAAPYIGLDGAFQGVSTPNPRGFSGAAGGGSLFLSADAIDVTGAVVFDPSIGQATLSTPGDLRLIGVAPLTAQSNGIVASTLIGQLAVNGDLTLQAAQVYPTTGSSVSITSTGAAGLIRVQGEGAAPATPYSAGGALQIQAAQVDQAGVVRVPLGTLVLGGSTASPFAPATTALTLEPGSITSVSADGVVIPYGTTTDQKEWYFTPTFASPLTAPPAGVLRLAGGSVAVQSGATVDLKGGGDVYAYEFISGAGGTRDVLDQYNPDQFSSTNGYQYPDGRQIYAIVPGLSASAVAALDPVYSSGYGALYGPSQAGQRVYLNAAPGLAAGWYTLLPAKYALLPGGLRVVQDTAAATPPPAGGVVQSDGSIVTSGYFGVAGVNTRTPGLAVFDVQSQAVIRAESRIALTYGDTTFAAQAAHDGLPVPQLPIDAGRLILNPLTALSLNAPFETTPAAGGRGSEVDISGASLTIDPASFAPAKSGTIVLTDASLSNLDAASLLLGGVRTDNADGTTSLDVTSRSITVASGVNLTAPEVLLATDGAGAQISFANGAAIVATGAVASSATGSYIIDGLAPDGQTRVQSVQGGFIRVANGPERLVSRLNVDATTVAGPVLVGAGRLAGTAVEVNSSDALGISDAATLTASDLAIGAGHISFGPAVAGALSVDAKLQALFAGVDSLTLSTPQPIAFAPGDYAFKSLSLDTPGLLLRNNGLVTINVSGALKLQNSGQAFGACGGAGALACRSGSLALSASQIDLGSGAIQTYGTDGGVSLTAANGVLFSGPFSLNVGSAALSIATPFVGDAGSGAAGTPAPSLTLRTTGAVTIADPAPAAGFIAPAGSPGASLTINGGAAPGAGVASVSITGTELRATSGTLSITSNSGIAISGGADLSTPGYQKVFGDAADSTTVSAQGGLLTLTALNGDISVSDNSTLSVGGGAGAAGALSLVAQNGQVYAYHGMTSDVVSLASTFDATAPGGGGSLTLDTGGAFDLSAFAAGSGRQFTGVIDIRSGQGDLTLSAGDSLQASAVQLTADGGQVVLSGTVSTAGPQGGNVSLFGASGLHLTSTALIDAHAAGFGLTSTRQASGGQVVLGVDGAGAITVDPGAVIDVAAVQTANRLVNMNRTNGAAYTYVAGDVGGSVTFRAPVFHQGGADTVNVSVQGVVQGASSVVLEGFRRFDLASMAANPSNVGVTESNGTIVLDLSASAAGKINPLADPNGPIVGFVRAFDVSADYAALGGLATATNFHPRPGIELDFTGNVVLASNWNLGAGVVNVSGAVAAGLMTPDAGLPGQYAVVSGAEGQILAHYATATYRVGGSFLGEPGVLSFRAGGSLTLNGSITDGFFQFRDQTDPGYLNYALGGGARVYQGSLAPGCITGDCSVVPDYGPNPPPGNFVYIAFPSNNVNNDSTTPPGGTLNADAFNNPAAPYSAAANTPAATGSLSGGTGDPLGSADLFPLLPIGSGPRVVDSWSYRLVAGADLTGSAGAPSVNPTAVITGSAADVTVQGQHVYSYSAAKGPTSYANNLNLLDNDGFSLPAGQWFDAFSAQTGLQSDAYSIIDYSAANPATRTVLASLAKTFFQTNPQDSAQVLATGQIETTLASAAQFLSYVSDNFAKVAPLYKAPPETQTAKSTGYATAPTLIRTGDGSIAVAASGNIDLRNGASPTILNGSGAVVAASKSGPHLGGTAIYTAGHLVQPGAVSATDVATGETVSVDLGATAATSDVFVNDPQNAYSYGVGSGAALPGTGYTGVLIANPVYADGGGSVDLNAGVDVLSRRNTFQEARLGGVGVVALINQNYAWIGSGDQPWRTGSIGSLVNIRINPQLFGEGVGTVGGGDISVSAGRNVSDLSIVATDAVTTGAAADSQASRVLAAFGGGDVAVTAGGSLLGGRLDVAAGTATLHAQGSIASAGKIAETGAGGVVLFVDNTLRVRLSDATVSLDAGGTVGLQGIAALGVAGSSVMSDGFYAAGSGVSVIAGQQVTIANTGADVVTPGGGSSGNVSSAVYPGSLEAVALTGALDLSTSSREVLLYPDPTGTLTLLAGGDIARSAVAQLDGDPTLLPGAFSSFAFDGSNITNGLSFTFPTVLSNTTDVILREQHNPSITHAGDPTPNRIVAGGDIHDLILSLAKQTRVAAGRDIINMVFLGQNVATSDISRITAGRDITATTTLAAPLIGVNPQSFGAQRPAVQGDTFIISGPGAFFLEAGRDAGPFLNAAVTNGYANTGVADSPTGVLTYGGGILTTGNLRNPWLPSQSADIFTEFGVANGQNFAGLISAYLSPAGVSSLPAYEFLQTTDVNGVTTADRSKPIYALSLVDWITSVAPDIVSRYDTSAGLSSPGANAPAVVQYAQRLTRGGATSFNEALSYLPQLAGETMPLVPWLLLNDPKALISAYGSENVSYQQAFDSFLTLPHLTQREFLLKDVYFNELIQTSLPASASYLKYTRGYAAVNTLFPGAYGYTQNSLNGGPSGASTTVETGNLDLRLATIQTDQGGDILILGPGGRVLAGSTVSTSVQAARRAYRGGQLYSGGQALSPYTAAITQIPVAYEGVLTLQGGSIESFTDGDFLLNQSRAFTEEGGDIAIWSSNADVNAGQGPRTTADIPPVIVRVDENGYSSVNGAGAVSGAGIGAFGSGPLSLAPDVFLIAPRGTVDAGDAGVRSAGNVFIAAFQVANANAIQAQGTVSGDNSPAAVNVGVQSSGDAASAAAAQAAQAATAGGATQGDRPLIIVDVLGFLADESDSCSDDDRRKGKCY